MQNKTGGYSNGGGYRAPMNGGGNGNGFRSNNFDRKPASGNSSQNGSTLRAIDWTNLTLSPFRKNFYKPSPSVLAQTQSDIEQFLTVNEITLKGTELPPPNMEFHDGVFPDYVMDAVKKQGFEKPTAIQAQAWPIALSGRDMVGIARTGSGKTLAYVLPSIVHVRIF